MFCLQTNGKKCLSGVQFCLTNKYGLKCSLTSKTCFGSLKIDSFKNYFRATESNFSAKHIKLVSEFRLIVMKMSDAQQCASFNTNLPGNLLASWQHFLPPNAVKKLTAATISHVCEKTSVWKIRRNTLTNFKKIVSRESHPKCVTTQNSRK